MPRYLRPQRKQRPIWDSEIIKNEKLTVVAKQQSFGLVASLLTLLTLIGCTDGQFLLSDQEKRLQRMNQGPPEREVRMMQVKYLSRDLELCKIRTNQSSLPDSAIRKLSSMQYESVILAEQSAGSDCINTLNFLIEKIELADSIQINHGATYKLLIEGQDLAHRNSK